MMIFKNIIVSYVYHLFVQKPFQTLNMLLNSLRWSVFVTIYFYVFKIKHREIFHRATTLPNELQVECRTDEILSCTYVSVVDICVKLLFGVDSASDIYER